jgi:long-subunit acyl-CoA synthetase (AMP-forming)
LLYATAWSGAVAVPVNIRWSANEIAYSLVEAQVRTLVVDDAFQLAEGCGPRSHARPANADPLRRPRHTALTCCRGNPCRRGGSDPRRAAPRGDDLAGINPRVSRTWRIRHRSAIIREIPVASQAGCPRRRPVTSA